MRFSQLVLTTTGLCAGLLMAAPGNVAEPTVDIVRRHQERRGDVTEPTVDIVRRQEAVPEPTVDIVRREVADPTVDIV